MNLINVVIKVTNQMFHSSPVDEFLALKGITVLGFEGAYIALDWNETIVARSATKVDLAGQLVTYAG